MRGKYERNPVAFLSFVPPMSIATSRLAASTARLFCTAQPSRAFASSSRSAQTASAKSTPVSPQTAFQAIQNDRKVAVTFPNGTESSL